MQSVLGNVRYIYNFSNWRLDGLLPIPETYFFPSTLFFVSIFVNVVLKVD